MSDNRRQFARILFSSEAVLYCPQAEVGVNVVDISLKGALLRPSGGATPTVGEPCTLRINLSDSGVQIRMEGRLVHQEGRYFGMACHEIDLDSMTHLRRLIELNLGDETALNRELSALAGQD